MDIIIDSKRCYNVRKTSRTKLIAEINNKDGLNMH